MSTFQRRLAWPAASLLLLSLLLLLWGSVCQGHSDFTAAYSLLGLIWGGAIAISSPVHREDGTFEPCGCLGWILGFVLSIYCSAHFAGSDDAWFLIIPVSAASAIQIVSYLRRRKLSSSPLLPVLVTYLSLAFYTIIFMESHQHRWEILCQLFLFALLTAVIQFASALLPPLSPRETFPAEKTAQEHHQDCLTNLKNLRHGDALDAACEAARLDPSFLVMQAICQAMAGDVEGSLPIYEQAIERQPGQAMLHANYAEDLMLCGRPEDALVSVERALSLDPNHAHAWALKARLLVAEQPETALDTAQRALEFKNCPVSIWETLAMIYRVKKDPVQTRECLRKFLALAKPGTLLENDVLVRLKTAEAQLKDLESNFS